MKRHRPPHRFAGTLIAAMLLALFALPAAAAAQAFQDEEEFRVLAEGLRNGTIPLSVASEQCRQEIAAGEGPEEIVQFMSTFLVVPEKLALAATCQAIMRAVKADEIPVEALVVFSRGELDSVGLFEIGRILRAVYFSHRLTTTASVVGQAAQ
ncbi:MAG: hypothetical protein GEU89_13040 [Kiloniellaceae bacterium]|nr:hypothetical protein [Kiloniellaceae bacterium]